MTDVEQGGAPDNGEDDICAAGDDVRVVRLAFNPCAVLPTKRLRTQ